MQKFTKKYIGYMTTLMSFGALFFSFYIYTSFIDDDGNLMYDGALLISFIAFIVVLVIMYIYNVLFYKCSGYELTDEYIMLKKGVVFKKKKMLRYDKINAVDVKQNIIGRFFNVKALSLDSGSTTKAHQPEVVIYESKERIDYLEKLVKAKMNNCEVEVESFEETKIENKGSIYNFTTKRKLLFTLFPTLVVVMFLFLMLSTLLVFFKVGLMGDETFGFIDALVVFSGLIVLVSLCSIVFGYIGTLLTYYDFRVYKENGYITVEHGLLSRVKNTLYLNKIKAVKIEEGLVKRMFGYLTVKLEVVGFGVTSSDEQKQQTGNNLLLPVCKKSEVNTYLNLLLEDFEYKDIEYKCESGAFKYFNYLPDMILTIIFISLIIPLWITFGFKVVMIGIILYVISILFVLVVSKLRYHNAGVSFSEKSVYIHRGVFNKNQIIIPNKNIIGINTFYTNKRYKDGLLNIKVHYFNNAIKNTETIFLTNKDMVNKINDVIKY